MSPKSSAQTHSAPTPSAQTKFAARAVAALSSGRTGGWLAKLASTGLVLVLLSVSGFALWASVTSRQVSERAVASSQMSDHFAAAATAVAAQESLERKYRVEPEPKVRTKFDSTSDALLGALSLVRQDGDALDRAIADEVFTAYKTYRQAVERLFDAVDAGDPALVRRIDEEESDPRFEQMESLIGQAAANHHQRQLAALAELQLRQNFNASAIPVAFVGGLLLVLLFSSVLRITRAQLEQQRKQAVHDATHDGLTGLPNRSLLAERFERALKAGVESGDATGLLLIDLDRFKEVNDTLGHAVGDQLLAQVGPRLVSVLRDSDTVARLGGDEFAVLLVGLPDLDAAFAIARQLRAALAESFVVQGVALDIDASIGVVVSGCHGDDAATLLQRADVAMYVAKQQGHGVMAYDPHSDEHSPERLSLLGHLRRGLERGELFLNFQPKLQLGSQALVGVEALVRWRHPERGVVPPNDFIPLAEHTGLIGPLTLFVLKTTLAQIKLWRKAGHDIPVAVNVSARNLLDEGFGEQVAELLAQYQVPARFLQIEVTESAVMLDPERASRILHQLHALGVRIAIDDFGAGYTSLAQLKNLPISELKIDKSFILSMQSSAADAHIVRSMINLGHSLRMKVVAEGVETAGTLAALSEYNCDVAQGYHLCRPLAAEALMQWHQQHLVVPGQRVRVGATEAEAMRSDFMIGV
jgi:diguanylate cyclase